MVGLVRMIEGLRDLGFGKITRLNFGLEMLLDHPLEGYTIIGGMNLTILTVNKMPLL